MERETGEREKLWRGQGWRRVLLRLMHRLASSTILAGLIAQPARATEVVDGLQLRLSGLGQQTFGLMQSAIPFGLALLVVTIYATAISLWHIRARRLWNDHFEEQNRTIRDALARMERSALFLATDKRLLVAWNGPKGEPEFEGDPALWWNQPILRACWILPVGWVKPMPGSSKHICCSCARKARPSA